MNERWEFVFATTRAYSRTIITANHKFPVYETHTSGLAGINRTRVFRDFGKEQNFVDRGVLSTTGNLGQRDHLAPPLLLLLLMMRSTRAGEGGKASIACCDPCGVRLCPVTTNSTDQPLRRHESRRWPFVRLLTGGKLHEHEHKLKHGNIHRSSVKLLTNDTFLRSLAYPCLIVRY